MMMSSEISVGKSIGILTYPDNFEFPIPGCRLLVVFPDPAGPVSLAGIAELLTKSHKFTVFTVSHFDESSADELFDYFTKEKKLALIGVLANGKVAPQLLRWTATQDFVVPNFVNGGGAFDGAFLDSVVLDNHTSVLSIYHREDAHGLLHADKYADAFGPRNFTRLVNDQDHHDIIESWLSPASERSRFMAIYSNAGLTKRWKDVEGVSNCRDLGGFRSPLGVLKSGMLFRAANPAEATIRGQNVLRALGIRYIYDLRSQPEIDLAPMADFEGIKTVYNPVLPDKALSPDALAEESKKFTSATEAFLFIYNNIFRHAIRSYRVILEHIRDRPEEPLLFHCMAGKDRTGMLSMILLSLIGVDRDTICREYELTTEGLLPEYPRIKELCKESGRDLPNEEALRNMLSSPYEACRNAMEVLDVEYGGAEGYLRDFIKFSDKEIAAIKRNLVVEDI
ncbi:hypothetical protein TRVA0_020S02036 [Trichomonascus vanleenenianus]|uniref:tyrosine-protein phosphatase n=1 Tax=Trichomonascus vanleenenianus TaxID=2268995 RepID=UPI003ECA232C